MCYKNRCLSRIRKVGLSRLRLLRRRCHLYVVRKGSSLKQLSPFAEYGGNDTMQQAGNPLFVYNYFL